MNSVELKIVPLGFARVRFAEDQPEYNILPGARDAEGTVITEWQPTAEELAALLAGGHVRLTIMTFNLPLQPVLLEVTE